MKEFAVTINRIGYSHATISVMATTNKEAKQKALDAAASGGPKYFEEYFEEYSADYEVEYIRPAINKHTFKPAT